MTLEALGSDQVWVSSPAPPITVSWGDELNAPVCLRVLIGKNGLFWNINPQ